MKLKVFLSLVLSLVAGIAGAADVRVLSSNAMREVLLEIAPAFEKASGHKLAIPREKYVQAKPGIQTGELVARGEAEICFQQLSELLPVKGIEYLGPLSADVGHVTVFAGGIHAAAEPQAARALMQYLASPAAAPVLRAKGMEPAQAAR